MMNWVSVITAVVFAFVSANPILIKVMRGWVYPKSFADENGLVQKPAFIVVVIIAAILGYVTGSHLANLLARVRQYVAPVTSYVTVTTYLKRADLLKSVPSTSKSANYTPGVDASAFDPSISATASASKASASAKTPVPTKPLKSAASGLHSQGTVTLTLNPDRSKNTDSDSGKTGSPLDVQQKMVREQLTENLAKIIKEKMSTVNQPYDEQYKCTFRFPATTSIQEVKNGSYPPKDCMRISPVRDNE